MEAKKTRAEGYYWVKVKTGWVIRYYTPAAIDWNNDEYWRYGLERLYDDSDVLEINETRILTPDESI